MTFLPIVERELRVAARRPGTYWTRWFAALGLIAVWLLLFSTNRRASAAALSQTLFVSLGVLALGYSLFAGLFLTADCLSEEKREGTLGLLFLTDLRGYDVVLGKLIATSVNSVYGLLAMLPVLALPLLMGGVTGGEFWRAALVLAATLFLSLSMGMFFSAAVREARQAMIGTLVGLVVLAGVPPTLRWLGLLLFKVWPPAVMVWPSPPCAFGAALDASYRGSNGPYDFWMSLQTLSGLSLGLLVAAAVWLPRSWQEKRETARGRGGEPKPNAGRRAGLLRQPPRHLRRLGANPYAWLAGRARSSDLFTRVLLGLLILVWLVFLGISVAFKDGTQAFVVCLIAGYALHQAGKYLVALEATRQLGEDRRSGTLELLLVTPLEETQILSGQKQALQTRSHRLRSGLLLVNTCLALAVLLGSDRLRMSPTDQAMFMELLLGGMLVLLADFKALQTVGMWMALRESKHHRAVLRTLGRVMLVPWVGIFLYFFLMVSGAFSPSNGELAAMFALWFAAGIVTDWVVNARARAKLGLGVRHWVAEVSAPGRPTAFRTPGQSIGKALYA